MKQLKILSVGNSFSWDTMEYLAEISRDLGIENVKFANLYVGGCSIKKHFYHAENDIHTYEYRTNTGDGWNSVFEYSIKDAVSSEDWDYISVQHGTADGSRYTDESCYEKLSELYAYIKKYASPSTKLAFNMTWVGEMDFAHPEIASYNGDQLKMYRDIVEVTKKMVLSLPEVTVVSPTGTAIQNARTANITSINRDGYHLTYGLGRYTAGLTFFHALTGLDISGVSWVPEGVTAYEHSVAVESALNAVANPFEITKSVVEE